MAEKRFSWLKIPAVHSASITPIKLFSNFEEIECSRYHRSGGLTNKGGLLICVISVANPGVASSISARSYTSVEIDHEIFSTVILLLPLIQEGFFCQ